MDTGIAKRDEHLRSKDFFEVEKFPTITFESRKVEIHGNKQIVAGTFTDMMGATSPLSVPVNLAAKKFYRARQ